MSKISICVNHFWPLVGGAEAVSRKIAEHLSKDHEVSIITRRVRGRDHSAIDLPIYEYVPGDWRSFIRHLDQSKPDIVFVYSDVFDFFRQLVTGGRNRFRLVIALCGANWIYSHRNFAKILFRNLINIDRIICHSVHDRDYKLCSGKEISKKVSIIPNGVDLDEFDNNSLERIDLQPDLIDKRWILNVSNFFPGKGQEHMVEILNQLPEPENLVYLQASSDIDFAIGQQLEAHWKKTCATKLNKKIQYKLVKNPPRSKLIGYFKQSNVFTFTSEKEVAPLVLLESMAAMTPWISADVGNAPGLSGGISVGAIKDSRYRSHYDERVFRLFAKHIPELWSTPTMGEAGRKQIEDEMTWDKVLPQYSSIFDR